MLDNAHSWLRFAPEQVLTGAILLVLAVDLVAGRPSVTRAATLTLGGLGAAALTTILTMRPDGEGLFYGLMARDPFGDYFKLLFILTNVFITLAAVRSRDAVDWSAPPPEGREGAAEFHAIMLTLSIAMMLMATATDLLTAFLSLEMASIMSYVLAGFRRRSRQSAEAALKYIIYGGVGSGVMLYGLSLLYGLAGSTSFTAVREAVAHSTAPTTVFVAVVLCLAGFGYKIAVVPFHMWCPDVFQGAPTPVTAYFSIAPKAAGFALLLRFFVGAMPPELAGAPAPWPLLLGLIAAASMTLGNLAALQQTNVKRMLGYSSVAHSGYMLLGVVAGGDDGTRALMLYVFAYVFMSVCAFSTIITITEAGLGDELAHFRGLGRRAPWPAAAMTIALFSLTGVPPFAGFFGKFYLFAALVAHGGAFMLALAFIGVLNSVISLYYYARVLKAMYFEPAPVDAPLPVHRLHSTLLALVAVPTVALGLVWSPLAAFADASLGQWYPPATRPSSAHVERSVNRSSVKLASPIATR